MALGPIPVSSINNYLTAHQLPDWWATIIFMLDQDFLAQESKDAS